MQCKYKAIFFDFDGVILNTLEAKGKAFAKLYTTKKNDKIFKEIMTFHLLNGGLNRIDKLRKIHKIINSKDISDSELNTKLIQLKIYMSEELNECAPIDDYILPLIRELSQTTQLWIVSAAPKDEIIKLCDIFQVTQYFNDILGSCNKTETLNSLLSNTGYYCDEVLFIGDAEEDFKASVSNKVPGIVKINSNNINPFNLNFDGNSINHFNELGKYL